MSEVLYLSHWNASIPVVVPVIIVKNLCEYHMMGIRFLYNSFSNGKKGAILNEDEDMNFPIQITAFLRAMHLFVTSKSPVIIVCERQSLTTWHYYLSLYIECKITFVNEHINNEANPSIFLATVEDLKWLNCKDISFFSVIIDCLDNLLNKRFVKQLKGQFHIGLTNRNFLREPDQKLFRSMLLWALPGSVGKLEDFCREDDDNFLHLRNPYSNHWFRLTWSFCESFKKPTSVEKTEHKIAIRNWAAKHELVDYEKDRKKCTRKRKKIEVKEGKSESGVSRSKRPPINNENPLLKIEDSSSCETSVCDSENYSILSSIMDDDVKPVCSKKSDNVISEENSNLLMSIMSDDDVKNHDEDNVEARNKTVLSALYGDED
ncbi:hypothetical protein FQA39_LY17337 [Lamprigera yunnana]|nr:hypothetical protein FQA39_LY17337 [Lamprigera yunnana]